MKIEFFNRVSQIDWSFVKCEMMDAGARFDEFITQISDAYLKSFPERTNKVKPGKPHKANWFTNDLRYKREHYRFLC